MEFAPVGTLGAAPLAANPGVATSKSRASRFSTAASRVLLFLLVLFIGIVVRVYCSSGFRGVGFDEHAYTVFLTEIEKSGALNYDLVMRVCLERQQRTADAIVPATRVGFLLPAYAVAEVFQVSPFVALRYLNCGAAILTLLITLAFSYRALGMGAMLGIGCLMATSPLAIHLSQRALVDGYFSLWATTAVWLAWENLRCPRHLGWLAAYFASLVLLVLTKESAAFVVVGLCAVLLWYGLQGCCPWRLWVATMAGPVVAIAVLATLTGGITKLVQFYYVFESKSGHNIYSVMAQDGPWYRYLIDFILLSPLITTFALGAIFHLRRSVDTALAIFLGASFVVMSAVSRGMSLRYAAYWELPLCWLAFLQVELLAEKVRRNWRPFAIAGMVVLLSATNLWQYQRLFVAGEIYDPISFQLARATHLIK